MAYEIYYSTSAESETLDAEFVELARKVCKKAIELGITLADNTGEEKLTDENIKDFINEDGIGINGLRQIYEGGEPFYIPTIWGSCKTHENPYTAVVMVLLALAQKNGYATIEGHDHHSIKNLEGGVYDNVKALAKVANIEIDYIEKSFNKQNIEQEIQKEQKQEKSKTPKKATYKGR